MYIVLVAIVTKRIITKHTVRSTK